MRRRDETAPGPKSAYGIRNVGHYMRDPLTWLRDLKERYGDFVEFEMLGDRWYVLFHPDDIETVLVKRAKQVKRDGYVEVVERALGKGLLTNDGESWRRQRKLMAQAFTPKRIREYGETMATVGEAGARWRDGEVIDVHEEMSRLTMEVVAAVLFGSGVTSEDVHTVGESMEVMNEFFANSPEAVLRVPEWVPTPRNLRMKKAVERIDAIVYEFIRKRRQSREDRDDLLGTLLAATDDETQEGMTDKQLRDEVITLFLAGHETTALNLAYTLMLLGQYPEVEKRVLAELDEVLAGRLPTAADSKALPYTEMVIKESMRLYPPAWLTGRETAEAIEVGGRTIPPKSQVIVSEWIVHRDPRFFPDPEAFVPERWEDAKSLPRYAYFPFGGGPRVCIGNHFAMMEAILLLAIVLQRYHLELLPNQRLELAPSITLRPKKGIRAVVKRRPEARAVAPAPQARAS